jgi:hypothetical protein
MWGKQTMTCSSCIEPVYSIDIPDEMMTYLNLTDEDELVIEKGKDCLILKKRVV